MADSGPTAYGRNRSLAVSRTDYNHETARGSLGGCWEAIELPSKRSGPAMF